MEERLVQLEKRVEELEKKVAAATTTPKLNIQLDGKKIAESIVPVRGR